MPTFIYEGRSNSLRVSGRTLLRGRPTELEGVAAESAAGYAAKHPAELHQVDGKAAAAKPSGAVPAGLAKRQALVARAKELGIPATGKNAELEAAIAAAEAEG